MNDNSLKVAYLLLAYYYIGFLPTALLVFQVEVVTLGITDVHAGASSLIFNRAAIGTAVESLRKTYGNVFNLTHTYIYDKKITNCLEITFYSDFLLSEWYYRSRGSADMYAFVSPTCLEETNVNRLLSNWNLLMLTSAAADSALRNKMMSPTRIGAAALSVSIYARLIYKVVTLFKWTTLYVIIDDGAVTVAIYPVIANTFFTLMRQLPDVQLYIVRVNSATSQNFSRVLQEYRRVSRVLLFFGTPVPLRNLMIQAAQEGICNGEFVYIAFMHYKSSGIFTWEFKDTNDEIARNAFRSLLLLSPDESIYNTPSEQLLNRWKTDSMRLYNFSFNVDAVPFPAVVSSYTMFTVFGIMLNETITTKPGFNFGDGRSFARLFFNRTFALNYSDVYFDNVGERVTTYLVNDLEWPSGKFKPVMFQDTKTQKLVFFGAIDWGGENCAGVPLNEPICGFRGDTGPCSKLGNSLLAYGVGFGSLCFFVLAVIFVSWFLRTLCCQTISERWWKLDYNMLSIVWNQMAIQASTKNLADAVSQNEMTQLPHLSGHAKYESLNVWVQNWVIKKNIDLDMLPKTCLAMLNQLRRDPHKNINRFLGLCAVPEGPDSILIISDYCSRSSLHELLERFNWFAIENGVTLALDMLNGIQFIHRSPCDFHGSLSGWNCLIDNHFTLKIAKFGYHLLKDQLEKKVEGSLKMTNKTAAKLYWTAPEIIRNTAKISKITDVYSVGVILYQILTASAPYKMLSIGSPIAVIKKIQSGSLPYFRPDTEFTSSSIKPALMSLITACWDEEPTRRPTVQNIVTRFSNAFRDQNIKTASFIENILSRLDGYAVGLEAEVLTRTQALLAEQQKCEDLLCEMLPRTVVMKLRNNHSVEAEFFESVTIMFCDLYGFTEVAAEKTPLEVTNLLNRLYSTLDPILLKFDVYKVETIGNVYMVASGVPLRNGDNHAKEICSLALSLYLVFTITSQEFGIFFRAGVHTGSCAAGVMGVKNPRYCLFGDTVNMASRMGSHSLPNQIHLSAVTAHMVINCSSFKIVERGSTEIKGKGFHFTFWLEPVD